MKYLLKILFSVFWMLIIAMSVSGQNEIISAREFKDLCKDKAVVIIDASKSKNYDKAHVKNAINVQHSDLYRDEANYPEGMLKDPVELAAHFGKLGIDENTTVVIYDEGTQKYAGRLFVILNYIGARNVKLTHRDDAEWAKNRIMLTSAPGKPGEPVTFNHQVQDQMIASLDYVREHLGNEQFVFVDTRDESEFIGEKKVVDGVFGRLPSTINIPYKEFETDSGAIKSPEELQALADEYGLGPDKEVIVFCRTGVKGSVAYIALAKVLGHPNVKLFDGGCTEYSAKYELIKEEL